MGTVFRRARTGRCLAVLGLTLIACSTSTRYKVLTVLFDGVPDPAATGSGDAIEQAEFEELAAAAEARPAAPVKGAVAVVPVADELSTWQSASLKMPLEQAASWQELLNMMPTDYAGGVDWIRAIDDKLVAPQILPQPEIPREPPFTLETLARLASGFPDRAVFDLDVKMNDGDEDVDPIFDVTFPHASHTRWLACASCHPGAPSMRTKMDKILAGEACGKCHGRVSFDPQLACARCHQALRPLPPDELDSELTLAQSHPMAATPELLERGAEVYGLYCAVCHGESGDSEGRLAPWVDTKPRDFTSGKYKFRSTIGSSPPTDLDIFRTITQGVLGTSMPAWPALPRADRWALVHFVKSFSERFQKEEAGEPISIPEPPERTPELAKLGEELYTGAGCHGCHGETGRGDGPSAPTLKDDWGNPIQPLDFASGRPIKSGARFSDIYKVVMAGLPGTPMPGFGQVLQPEQAWALASHVESLRGTARRPFAVRGDIAFERQEPIEEPPVPQGQDIAALDVENVDLSFEDELFLLAGKDVPPATFPHWFHRIRFRCASCHPGIFQMEAGSNPITMTAMRRGEFCASCHNGKVAWQIRFETCPKCHQAR